MTLSPTLRLALATAMLACAGAPIGQAQTAPSTSPAPAATTPPAPVPAQPSAPAARADGSQAPRPTFQGRDDVRGPRSGGRHGAPPGAGNRRRRQRGVERERPALRGPADSCRTPTRS